MTAEKQLAEVMDIAAMAQVLLARSTKLCTDLKRDMAPARKKKSSIDPIALAKIRAKIIKTRQSRSVAFA